MSNIVRFIHCVLGSRLAILGVAVVLSVPPTWEAAARESPPHDGYRWLDVEGRPLPFQDDDTIRQVMSVAQVVHREKVSRGVAGVEKILLEKGGVRFHAAFRTVDVIRRRSSIRGVDRSTIKYRDAAVFERAAYELSRLLEIDRVPPVVVRRIGDQSGTLQIWVEEAEPEVELVAEDRLKPPDIVRWRQQRQIMHAFDSLLANADRNQGNILIDRKWTLWFIDHTRAFRTTSKLLDQDHLHTCERSFWKALREIDDLTIRRQLEPFLERHEISDLLLRRHNLVRYFKKLIKKNGEESVLFDLSPPATDEVGWSDGK